MTSLQSKLAMLQNFQAKKEEEDEPTVKTELSYEVLQAEVISWGKYKGTTFEQASKDLKWT